MLVLTENATTVIRAIIDRAELPDSAGLRIAAAADGRPEALTVSPADTPVEGDVVLEEAGARVFVESDVAVMLDDQVLDARVDEEGGVEFLLAGQ